MVFFFVLLRFLLRFVDVSVFDRLDVSLHDFDEGFISCNHDFDEGFIIANFIEDIVDVFFSVSSVCSPNLSKMIWKSFCWAAGKKLLFCL